jgi:hypothetical protein
MKKLDDKIIVKEKREQKLRKENEQDHNYDEESINCDCCSCETPTISSVTKASSSPSFSNTLELSKKENDDSGYEHKNEDNDVLTGCLNFVSILNKKFLLIVIGLVLTIPIVLLDIITLALATPIQLKQ